MWPKWKPVSTKRLFKQALPKEAKIREWYYEKCGIITPEMATDENRLESLIGTVWLFIYHFVGTGIKIWEVKIKALCGM